MNTIQMYDAQASSINVDNIATKDNNRVILRRIKRNIDEDTALYIQNHHDEQGEDCIDYVPEGAYDMGWLGYFMGRNDYFKELYFRTFTPTSGASVEGVLEPFLRGLNNNKSIEKLDYYRADLLGGRVFTMLGQFFENSRILANITIENCHLGDNGCRLLALALGSIKSKSLQNVILADCILHDGSIDIITSLSMHPGLEHLDLNGNRLSTNGCLALSTLLQNSCTKLQYLYIENNEIDDEGIDALAPALEICTLPTLRLGNNLSVTTRGWRRFASILEAPTCSLKTLYILGRNVDDEAVVTLTSALANNHKFKILGLRRMGMPTNSSITEKSWEALAKLLCDTSSINSTFLSNHTLCSLGGRFSQTGTSSLQKFLLLNKNKNKKEVAMIKILQHHNEFDMTPFFEWEFKVLPLMIDWFEKASTIDMPEDYEPNIGPRKLSSIYQFVRGMPLLYVETRIRKELEGIKSKESQMEKEHLLLRQEQLMLDLKLQRLRQRKQSVKDRKESLLDKLA